MQYGFYKNSKCCTIMQLLAFFNAPLLPLLDILIPPNSKDDPPPLTNPQFIRQIWVILPNLPLQSLHPGFQQLIQAFEGLLGRVIALGCWCAGSAFFFNLETMHMGNYPILPENRRRPLPRRLVTPAGSGTTLR